MSTGIFNIGITGMNAAQLGLMTTGHNISNSDTQGYNRQRIIQATAIAQSTGAGFIGQGTTVVTISRSYNSFLQEQISRAQTTSSELDTNYTQLTQIDNMLADTDAGLSPALQDFFSGLQEVAADPSSISARQTFVSSAQSLATRFQTLEARLSEQYEGVNEQISNTTDLVNSYAQQIAKLNQSIILAKAGSGQPPNDLLDQRDQLLADLNKEIKVSTVTEANGSVSVFVGSGQQLVMGPIVNKLDARPSSADSERLTIGLVTGSNYQELPERLIVGGNLAGYLRFRSDSLDGAANALGQVAASLANVLNTQQSLGQDLLGQTVANVPGFAAQLFVFDTTNVPKIIANTNNSGTATISATAATAAGQTAGYLVNTAGSNLSTELTASDYRLRFSSATTFTVTRLSDGVAVATEADLTGSTISFDGLSLDVNMTGAQANDSFLIEPTREAARNISVNPAIISDPRLIAAAAPIKSAASSASNTGSGAITAPVVSQGYTIPASPITLSYSATTVPVSFSGFPAGSTVTVKSGTTTSTYTITAATDPVPYTAGATVSFNGISFQISGAPANGDSFTLQANTGGVSDSRNAVIMGSLQTQKTMLGDASGGKANFQDVYAQLVSAVGNKTRELEITSSAQASLLEQAQSARDSLSAVNLDEEAANLLRYQYAYQASAKMLQIGSELFDTVLSLGN
ncbi:flagellar hook-associated protein FlgK [Rhodocyclus tenuis]|uniref:Flagellar hook-associated protein 1 n=1 Tax=Rhodocyclus tenuis TaxID=1066 RepID=A0A840G2Q8_RHOTE|nr:flagellar hook-associated protein FlgK [Rhodocyclus tenuis]MBB4246693.1 flagellar hook-associated protein 1 FlgK [Rhodocyclus tenuis]MBK1679988.1 flagellar hook-associated protein FlgK [Rhodocyclus tenuis]